MPDNGEKLQKILDKCPNHCRLDHARTDDDGRKVAVFSFSKEGFGFGEIAIVTTPDGRSFIDGESMTKKTVLSLFELLWDSSICDTDKHPDEHLEYNRNMGVRSCGCCGYNKEEDKDGQGD
jgi:hypothetical protein